MIVNNVFIEDSLKYRECDGKVIDIYMRMQELSDLEEIVEYCKQIGEKIFKNDEKIYEIEVCKGIPLYAFLFTMEVVDGQTADIIRRLQDFIDKGMSSLSIQEDNFGKNIIGISLGESLEHVANIKEYIHYRRSILRTIEDPLLYGEFMKSCFPNSEFADNIIEPLIDIEDFPKHVVEITDNLIVLDDQAVDLYKKYSNDLATAMNCLKAQLRECTYESNRHKTAVTFRFAYAEIINGEKETKYKDVVCSPHLKLIRNNSNLRIYFYWCDPDVGDGEKVLVGRIGGHPYPDPKKNR